MRQTLHAVKTGERWRSERLQRDVSLVRWGHYGQPVLVFPTAGGDAEEIERMGLIDAVGDLLGAGRIKVYSCDSVAGVAMVREEGSPAYRAAIAKAYQEYTRYEVIPAIRADCRNDDSVITAGASIGAFNALAMLCRYPDVVSAAVGMSGTYDVSQLVGDGAGDDLYFATPMFFLPRLNGEHVALLRTRFAILAVGQGRWENVDQTWRMAGVLGDRGVPNRVEVWGWEFDHDWPTWRHMLPQYLRELTGS